MSASKRVLLHLRDLVKGNRRFFLTFFILFSLFLLTVMFVPVFFPAQSLMTRPEGESIASNLADYQSKLSSCRDSDWDSYLEYSLFLKEGRDQYCYRFITDFVVNTQGYIAAGIGIRLTMVVSFLTPVFSLILGSALEKPFKKGYAKNLFSGDLTRHELYRAYSRVFVLGLLALEVFSLVLTTVLSSSHLEQPILFREVNDYASASYGSFLLGIYFASFAASLFSFFLASFSSVISDERYIAFVIIGGLCLLGFALFAFLYPRAFSDTRLAGGSILGYFLPGYNVTSFPYSVCNLASFAVSSLYVFSAFIFSKAGLKTYEKRAF
jgi:hypothetical protein